MKHTSQTAFGRPVSACQPSPDDTLCDKWQIVGQLTTAAERFEVSHTTLGVLKSLVSFLPGRVIGTDRRGNTVFPSNATLSHRLNGMPESTLRRHLARLTQLGLIARRNSPNGKRYARNLGQGAEVAFGFDLSPLAHLAGQINAAAADARAEADTLRALQAEVAELRQRVLAKSGATPLTEDARRLLRRKPIAALLTAMHDALSAQITPPSPPELSASDSQNGRHIQVKLKYNSDAAPARETGSQKKENPTVTLAEVLDTCKEVTLFFPQPLRNWSDLHRVASRLSQMIGIDPPVWAEASQRMGPVAAAISVACIVESLDRYSNPGGYLRHLARNCGAGGFDPGPLLQKTREWGDLSADNQKIRYKTNA